MKTKRHIDRKTHLDGVLFRARRITSSANECQQAWLRLCRELEFMSEPEAKMPRFNRLLNAIYFAATNEEG